MTAPRTTTAHLEARLEAFFQERVRAIGGFSVKLAPTERGIPDRLALLPGGCMVLVELKAEGGKGVSPIQQHWHEKARRLGIHVVVLTGKAEVSEWLRQVVDDYSERLRAEERRQRSAQRRAEKAS